MIDSVRLQPAVAVAAVVRHCLYLEFPCLRG